MLAGYMLIYRRGVVYSGREEIPVDRELFGSVTTLGWERSCL